MRMGIMGGTLDPIHNGHIEIARAVKRACGLDGILLLPAGDPPHKHRQIDKMDRLEMTRLAAQSEPDMTVSDMEVMREGKTYTVDTLTQLHREFPGTQWVYIIGADTVKVLDSWKSFDQVAGLCEFAAVGRPGFDASMMAGRAAELKAQYGAKIHLLDVCGPDISSTDVRERQAEGKPLGDLVPPEVEAYIRNRGLYLCGMSFADVEEKLRQKLKPGRFVHTMGVAETAQRLAERNGVDPMRARLAGLLHDCAKWMSYEEMVALVRGSVPDADQEELDTEPVLHAPAGMLVAEREYGVKDPGILSAIRKHTLGGAGMTALEKLIYVADFIEPNRKPFDGLEDVRALAETDLEAATRMCAQLTSRHVVDCGGTPNPRTLETIQG